MTVAVAAPLSVIVAPLPLAVGLIVPEMLQVCEGGTMLRVNVTEPPEAVPVRVAICELETVATVAVKFAVDAPASTVTDAGTLTFELLLERVTLNPPEGAAEVSVTVQVDDPGEVTVAGLQERLLSAGGGSG